MPAPFPVNADQGSARIVAQLVPIFDRKDGSGADWPLMLESLFKAGFQIADTRTNDTTRTALMRRVHAGSYNRITGGEPVTINTPLEGSSEFRQCLRGANTTTEKDVEPSDGR